MTVTRWYVVGVNSIKYNFSVCLCVHNIVLSDSHPTKRSYVEL